MALEGNKGIGLRSIAAFAKFKRIALICFSTPYMFECFSIFRVISCDDPIAIGMPGSRNADGGAAQPRPGLP